MFKVGDKIRFRDDEANKNMYPNTYTITKIEADLIYCQTGPWGFADWRFELVEKNTLIPESGDEVEITIKGKYVKESSERRYFYIANGFGKTYFDNDKIRFVKVIKPKMKTHTFKFGDKVANPEDDLRGVVMRDYIDVPGNTKIEIAWSSSSNENAWITDGWIAENLGEWIVYS